MSTSPKPNNTPKIIDRAELNEVYATKVISIQNDGGPFVITFGVMRMIPARMGDTLPPEAAVLHIVQRLALSPLAAMELVNALQGTLRNAGITQLPPTPPVGSRAN